MILAVSSFFTNKNLSMGEGGSGHTTSAEMGSEMRYVRAYGMTALTLIVTRAGRSPTT